MLMTFYLSFSSKTALTKSRPRCKAGARKSYLIPNEPPWWPCVYKITRAVSLC